MGCPVREAKDQQAKLFLTFAGGDLPLVRPVAAAFRQGGALGLDYAVTTEPFAAQRSDLIRASLELRIRRCAAAVCLYGAGTLDDAWVRWTLAAARRLELPLFGAPLVAGTGEAAALLAGLGIEIVPLRREAIAQRLAQPPEPLHCSPFTAESLALTWRMMKHPLR